LDFFSARANSILRLALAAILAGALGAATSAFPAQAIEAQPPAAKHSKMHAKGGSAKKAPAKGASTAPAPATTSTQANPDASGSEPPPPYETQLQRLAEILGALTYLDDLCGLGNSGDWRSKMQALLEAEAKTTFRKERLAGLFNRSFRGYERSYRACTPNAQAVITRFLTEGGALAHEVVNRFSAS